MKNDFHNNTCDCSHIFLSHPHDSGVKSRPDSPAAPCREAGVTHNVLAPRSFLGVFCMEDRAPVIASTEQSSSSASKHYEGRGAWVLTAYGISGLALFGVLAYFFSDFISH
jgi:hypothetical protein